MVPELGKGPYSNVTKGRSSLLHPHSCTLTVVLRTVAAYYFQPQTRTLKSG